MKKESNLSFFSPMVVIFILININSCDHETTLFDIPVFLTGIVRDNIFNNPIDSAWIGLADNMETYSTYTDSSGKYDFSFFIGSEHRQRIFVGKSGFLTFDTLIQFSIPQEDFDTVNIYLTPE